MASWRSFRKRRVGGEGVPSTGIGRECKSEVAETERCAQEDRRRSALMVLDERVAREREIYGTNNGKGCVRMECVSV